MTEAKKMATLMQTEAATETSQHLTVIEDKLTRILRALLHRTLNRFEAEAFGDHCLNSTIAKIREMGIVLADRWETVPALGGRATAHVKRYWVDRHPDHMTKARNALGMA